MATRKGNPQGDVQGILDDIARASKSKSRCIVGDVIAELPEAAQKAFHIALTADKDEYPHAAIQRKLEEISGKHVGKSSLPKHRLSMQGLPGGCCCASS